jgi:hypothetical protein
VIEKTYSKITSTVSTLENSSGKTILDFNLAHSFLAEPGELPPEALDAFIRYSTFMHMLCGPNTIGHIVGADALKKAFTRDGRTVIIP